MLLLNASVCAQMRCGSDLIFSGDSVIKLLEACGAPAIGDPSLDFGKWTYNFGPHDFMVEVTIIDGKVERFETLGKGFTED